VEEIGRKMAESHGRVEGDYSLDWVGGRRGQDAGEWKETESLKAADQ
jgi:hypothetical protein